MSGGVGLGVVEYGNAPFGSVSYDLVRSTSDLSGVLEYPVRYSEVMFVTPQLRSVKLRLVESGAGVFD